MGETHPVVARRDVGQRARTEPGLAGREDDEIGCELKAEYLVDLEAAVVRSAGHQLHEGEKRVVLVEHAVGREVKDPAAWRFSAKHRLGGGGHDPHLHVVPRVPLDGFHYTTGGGKCCEPGSATRHD